MIKTQIIPTKKPFPIWLMRQSGRYLPEYKVLREKYSFMEILKNPELIANLTLLPLKHFDLDALIIFSDISIFFSLLEGIEYDIVENIGPVVKIHEDIKKIKIKSNSEILDSLKTAIKIVTQEKKLPLIGFIGGIYTLIHYLTKNSNLDKTFIYSNEDFLFLIIEGLYKIARLQIEAGADIIQIFDTYLFDLSPVDIEFYILPYYKMLLNKIKAEYPQIPLILFSLNTFHIIDYIKEFNIDCLSVDWKKDLDIYFNNFEGFVQGNLDPHILTIQCRDTFQKMLNLSLLRIFKSIEENESRYIFNVGHGLLPNTKIENIQFLIEKINEYKGG